MAIKLRPTFTVDLSDSCTSVAQRLKTGLDQTSVWTKWARVPGARSESPCEGTFVWIAMPEKDQRFWSPWLQVSILPHDDGTQLFGRFSPRPAVWTAFALSYLFLACVAFFSCMFGMAQLILRQHAWGFWIALGASVIFIVMWWASQLGQRLADEQMHTLRQTFDQAITLSKIDADPSTSPATPLQG